MNSQKTQFINTFLDPKVAASFLKKCNIGQMETLVITPLLPMACEMMRRELLKLSEMDPAKRSEIGKGIIMLICSFFDLQLDIPDPPAQWKEILDRWSGAPAPSYSLDGSPPALNGSLGDSQPGGTVQTERGESIGN
jgi:hypothetical protein